MINSELINYIKQSLGQNIGEQEIKNTLLAAGWPQTDINGAVSTVKSLQAVNASAGITSNYSADGNGFAALQNSGQTMQEPIIGAVKGLESGTAQFWTSAPAHYTAIFTPIRVIFLSAKKSTAASVVSGLLGGMIGSAINLVDEEFKMEDMIKELSVKGVNNILGEHPEAIIIPKENLSGVTFKQGSFWNGNKGKISVIANGLTKTFYAPDGQFKRFNSLFNGLINGSFQPIQNIINDNVAALDAGLDETKLKKHKTITAVIAVVLVLYGAIHLLGALVLFSDNIAEVVSLFIIGSIYLVMGILVFKMKRWALYLFVASAALSIVGILNLRQSAGITAGALDTATDAAISLVSFAVKASIAAYLWSIRRFLK